MDPSYIQQQQELFYNAILNDDIDFLTTFLQDSTTSPLYSQFRFEIDTNFLPLNAQVSPIIIAMFNENISILQLLIRHQLTQQHASSTSTTPTIPFNPSTYKEYGFPLLHYAIASENNEVIDYIFSLYSLPQQSLSTTTTTDIQSLSNSQSTSSTQPTTIDINTIISDDDGNHPLQFAVCYSGLDQIKHLVEHYKCNPLLKNQTGSTILHYSNSIQILDYLMSLDGVQDLLEAKECDGCTPLFIMARTNNSKSFTYLLQHHNANIQCQDKLMQNVAHYFSEFGNIEMIDFISNINPDLINQVDMGGNSILISALQNNQLPMVKHLIENYGANVNQKNDSGYNNLYFATQKGSIELIDYLFTAGLDKSFIEEVDDDGYTPLCFAAISNNFQAFRHLVYNYNANPLIVTKEKSNMMHRAVVPNNMEMINEVSKIFETFDCDVHPNITLPTGYPRLTGEWLPNIQTPLYKAIATFKLQSLKQLVRLKANITSFSTNVSLFEPYVPTILYYSYHFALQKNDYSIFQYLLSDECIEDWHFQKELKFNDPESIKIYGQKDPIASQLNIHAGSRDQNTLLLEVARQHDLTAMKLLIEKKANINIIGSEGANIIHQLFLVGPKPTQQQQNNLLDIINYLSSIPSINLTNILAQKAIQSRSTPLLLASYYSSFPIVQKLIDLGSDINQSSAFKQTFLHFAASNLNFNLISQSLSHYPKLLQQQLYQLNNAGRTPFHISIALVKTSACTNQNQVNNTIMNDDEHNNKRDFDFHNPDVEAFIQHDRTLLLQKTKSKQTILHLAVKTEDELPTRLAGLIEALIDNIDILL